MVNQALSHLPNAVQHAARTVGHFSADVYRGGYKQIKKDIKGAISFAKNTIRLDRNNSILQFDLQALTLVNSLQEDPLGTSKAIGKAVFKEIGKADWTSGQTYGAITAEIGMQFVGGEAVDALKGAKALQFLKFSKETEAAIDFTKVSPKGFNFGSYGSEALDLPLWSVDASEVAAETTPKLLPHGMVANAGGNIVSFSTQKTSTYFRVYSSTPNGGSFLTKVPPKSSAFAIEGLALPEGNTASFIQKVTVPNGVVLQRSRAIAAFGRRGGLEQFQILNFDSRIIFHPGIKLK